MRSFQITPVIGLPKFDGWAQMVTPSEHVQLVVAVAGKNAPTLGKDLIEWLSGQQFSSPQEIHQVLLEATDRASEAGAELQFALHAQLDQQHVFAALNGAVLLKRGSKVGALLQLSDSMNLVLGKLDVGDAFVLSTRQAASLLSTVQQQFEQGFDSDSIITSTVPIMHGESDSSLSALVFGDVLVDAPVVLEEPLGLEMNEPSVLYDDAEAEDRLESHYSTPEYAAEAAPKVQEDKKLPTAIVLRTLGKGIQRVFVLSKAGVIGLFKLGQQLSNRRNGGVYVESRDFRKWARVAVPITAILVVGILFGVVTFARRSQQIAEASEALEPLNSMLQSSREDVSNNPIAARQEVSQVIGQLEQMQQAWQDRPEGQKKVMALLNEARQLYEDISGREEFKELDTFYDLKLTSPGEGTFLAQASFNDGNQAAFLDKDRKEIITLDLSTKQFQRQKVEGEPNLRDITIEGRTVWMLGSGLRSASLSSGSAVTVARSEEDANRAATLIQAYGANTYVVNPDQQTIYRYSQSDSGLGDSTNWIRSGQGIAFDQITSMAIDGDVWLGTRDGQIKKLTTGRPVEFAITGLNEPFTSALSVVTTENTDNLYVLEPSKSRVVILTKSGEYLREFKSSSLASATDLLVNEDAKQLLAVSGSMLLSLPL